MIKRFEDPHEKLRQAVTAQIVSHTHVNEACKAFQTVVDTAGGASSEALEILASLRDLAQTRPWNCTSAKKELKKICARWYGFSVSNQPHVRELMACPKDVKPWYDPDTWRTRTGEIEEKLTAAL